MFVPAYLAGRISPLEGMRFVAADTHSHVTPMYILGSVMHLRALRRSPGRLHHRLFAGLLTTYIGVVFTLSFVLVVPILLGPMARLAAAVLQSDPWRGRANRPAANPPPPRRAPR